MYQAVTAGSDPYGSMAQSHNTSGPSLSSQSKGFQAPDMMMMVTATNNNNNNHTQQQQQQQQQHHQNAMDNTSKNQPQSFSLPFGFDSATTNNLLQMSLQDPNMFANLLLWKALQDANNGVNADQQQQQVQQQQQPQHEQQQVPQQQIQQAQQPQQQQAQRQQQVQPQNQQQLQQQQHLQQLQLQQQQIQQQLLQSYALATGSQATQQQPQAAMSQTTPQVHQTQFSSYQTSGGTNSAVPSLSSSHAFHPYGVGSSTSSSQATPFQTLSSNHQQAMAPAPAAVTANTTTSHQHTDLQGTSNTHNKKLFALQTFVKPVSREGNNDSPLNDDLWRLFTGDYDDEDDGDSPEETPSSEPIKPAYSTPTLAPLVPMRNAATTTLSAMANPSTVEAPLVTLEPIVSAPSWLQPQQQQQQPQQHNQQQQQQQSQQQPQQHQQPTPTLSSVSSSPAVPPLSSKPFLSTAQQEAAADRQYMMVPPTLFPPTLLGSNTHPSRNSDTASGSSQQSRNKAAAAKAASTKVKAAGGGRYRKDGGKGSSTTVTPYEHLKTILAERGFTIPKTKSSEAGYVTTPSPLQLASFGTKLVKAVHASDAPLLSSLLECGLSPNPCNQFRDSILDLVCKRANEPIFQCLLDHNADLQVCDGFGRTPLHHAAWASTFSSVIVHAILKRDPSQAFLEDNRGQTPLEYVRPSLVSQWISFLDEHKDEFWPMGGDANMVTSNPPKRRDLQLADPPNALSVDLAGLVSSGVVEPAQVAAMDELTRRTYQMDQFQ